MSDAASILTSFISLFFPKIFYKFQAVGKCPFDKVILLLPLLHILVSKSSVTFYFRKTCPLQYSGLVHQYVVTVAVNEDHEIALCLTQYLCNFER